MTSKVVQAFKKGATKPAAAVEEDAEAETVDENEGSESPPPPTRPSPIKKKPIAKKSEEEPSEETEENGEEVAAAKPSATTKPKPKAGASSSNGKAKPKFNQEEAAAAETDADDAGARAKKERNAKGIELMRELAGQKVALQETDEVIPCLADIVPEHVFVRPGSYEIKFEKDGKEQISLYYRWNLMYYQGGKDTFDEEMLPAELPPAPCVEEKLLKDSGKTIALKVDCDPKKYQVPYQKGFTHGFIFETWGRLTQDLKEDPKTHTLSANIRMVVEEDIKNAARLNRRIAEEFDAKRPWFNTMRLMGDNPETGEPYPDEHPNYKYVAAYTKHKGLVYLGGEYKTKDEKAAEAKRRLDAKAEYKIRRQKNPKAKPPVFIDRDPIDLILNHPDIRRGSDYLSGELKAPFFDTKRGEWKHNYHLVDGVEKKHLRDEDFKKGNLVKIRVECSGGSHDMTSENPKLICRLLARYDQDTGNDFSGRKFTTPWSNSDKYTAVSAALKNKKRPFHSTGFKNDGNDEENEESGGFDAPEGPPSKKPKQTESKRASKPVKPAAAASDDGDIEMTEAGAETEEGEETKKVKAKPKSNPVVAHSKPKPKPKNDEDQDVEMQDAEEAPKKPAMAKAKKPIKPIMAKPKAEEENGEEEAAEDE